LADKQPKGENPDRVDVILIGALTDNRQEEVPGGAAKLFP
jgi:hypothetical protein